MNYNINSSGLYDVNAYNLTANNATILSTLNVNGNVLGSNNTLFQNPITCIMDRGELGKMIASVSNYRVIIK